MSVLSIQAEPIVITGIGLLASVGKNRESVWRAVQRGESQFRFLTGLRGIPDNEFVGAVVDLDEPLDGRHKVVRLCERTAEEAIADSGLNLARVDRDRFGCSMSSHMADMACFDEYFGEPPAAETQVKWWDQCLPNTSCSAVARKFDLRGPRLCHSTACASSLVSVLAAARCIRDRQCDLALAGGGDVIHPLLVAGFHRMRVLAQDPDPSRACRPFDRTRKGFVFGEGSAMFVLESLSHALRRRARIYAEISATAAVSQAHHVTGLDADSESLTYLIQAALGKAGLEPKDVGYINAHGTGTEQNDLAEAVGICRAFGPAASQVCVSSTKSILGHMIHAAGAVELAITTLALRDGFAPPTLNLTDPDPACRFDCLPLVGRKGRFEHALKLSLAFGGHLFAIILSRWEDPACNFAYPSLRQAA